MTLALFAHPAIKALQGRRIGVGKIGGNIRNPQYLSGSTFSRALVDTLIPNAVADPSKAGQGSVISQLETAVKRLPVDTPLRDNLLSLLLRAGGDMSKFEALVEKWYDDQMAMLSGWYKRWSRVVLGVFGLVVAVMINVDTVQVAHSLYVDAPTRDAVVATASSGALCENAAAGDARKNCINQEFAALDVTGVPLGYASNCNPIKSSWSGCFTWNNGANFNGWDVILKIVGWLVTAFAVSFGAPFWFEALSKLGNLRNTGTKPASTG
ncbi:MAG: hypothetical protein JWM76_798 [Pseudonocardiales bacterium]|nr:hypothetical protein [Pseudonocardiales bacterium]